MSSDEPADPRNPDRWDAFDPSERYSDRLDRCIKKLRENDSNLAASVTVTIGNDGYVRESTLAAAPDVPSLDVPPEVLLAAALCEQISDQRTMHARDVLAFVDEVLQSHYPEGYDESRR